MRRHPGRLALAAGRLVLSAFAFFQSPTAWGAFEQAGRDPVTVGVSASGPAWPLPFRPAGDQGLVFGHCSGRGLAVHSTRWLQIPDLEATGAVGWHALGGGSILVLRLMRLRIDPYAETGVELEIMRPAARSGWGWFAAASTETWSSSGRGEMGLGLKAGIGFAPSETVRAALRVRDHEGSRAGRNSAALEIGVTVDPSKGLRIGLSCETGPGGGVGSVRSGAECRPARDVVLRLGLSPVDSGASLGVGVEKGGLAIDVARQMHPRLGTVMNLGLAVRSGRAPQGMP